MKKHIFYLIFLFVLPGSLYCQDYTQAIEKSAKTIKALMKIADIPGLQVAVSIGDDIVYEQAFGVLDIKSGVPLINTTRMRIGSVTKLFTATAVAKLLEEGKIALDDDIRKYVPEFPDKGYPITIRQLLTHSSGIRHYTRDEQYSLNEKGYSNLTDALEKFKDDTLLYVPGTSSSYSSFGYVLLGAMIEKVSKQDFNSFILNEVISPAGLVNTLPESRNITEKSSFYYHSDDGGYTFAEGEDYSYKWPAGGYLSTSSDLVTFCSSLLNGKIISIQYVDTMTSVLNPNEERTKYGMGFRIGEDFKGRTVIHHGGTTHGARAFFLIYPEKKLTIAITVNVFGAPIFEGEAETIAGYFLNDFTEVSPPFSSDVSFTTNNNKKPVEGQFDINNNEGFIQNFSSSNMPVTDVVNDGSYIRIISISPSGIVNFWLGRGDKQGDNFWGYDNRTAEVIIK